MVRRVINPLKAELNPIRHLLALVGGHHFVHVSRIRVKTLKLPYHGKVETPTGEIIRAIHGKTLRDKIRSDQLQQLSGIQDIVKWVNVRRREWDSHVNRMEDNRLTKIARDNRPQREYVVEADQRNDGKKVST
jgi:hypothetical protein